MNNAGWVQRNGGMGKQGTRKGQPGAPRVSRSRGANVEGREKEGRARRRTARCAVSDTLARTSRIGGADRDALPYAEASCARVTRARRRGQTSLTPFWLGACGFAAPHPSGRYVTPTPRFRRRPIFFFLAISFYACMAGL